MSKSNGSGPATTRSRSSSAAELDIRLRAEQEKRRREAAQGDAPPPLTFRAYIALVSPKYQFYRHCKELIAVLQQVADGTLTRVMVFEPPRHGKSELVSRLFPAYYLYRYPDRFVGLASYGADLAYTLSRAAREFYLRGGGQLHKASRAVKQWLTREGGGLWAAGVGGPATGKGFHLGIIDDPIKDAKEAASEAKRAGDQDWYGSVWTTREEPGGAIVIVQTRWSEADLSGYVLELEAEEPERWYIVHLPAICDPDDLPTYPATCTVHPDWREPGEPLCPERYPLERLKKVAKRIREYFFGALFQQRPRPRSGGMFRRQDLEHIVGAAPRTARRVRYWDLAGADQGKGDWTVGALVALHADRIVIEDVVRGQWPAAERNAVIRQTARDDRRRGTDATYIEQPPGLAKEACDTIIRLLLLDGVVARADPVHGDKVSRAEPLAACCQAQLVDLVAGDWHRAFFEELESFPHGKNDDQVDAGAGGVNRLLDPTQWQSEEPDEDDEEGIRIST